MAARAVSLAKRLGYAGLGIAAAGAFVDQCLYNGTQLILRGFLIVFNHQYAVSCSCSLMCFSTCETVFPFPSPVWGGERAVIFDRLRQKVLTVASGEGTHFIIPFFQKANIFSIRSTPRSIPVVTGSKGDVCSIPHYTSRGCSLQSCS